MNTQSYISFFIYNLHPHGLFLNFLCVILNYTSHLFYSLHPHRLFLKFSMCDIIQHFIFFFIAYTHMDCILIFRCMIIYNLYLYELFFNFLMWDNYTNFTFFFIAYIRIHMNCFLTFLYFMSHIFLYIQSILTCIFSRVFHVKY